MKKALFYSAAAMILGLTACDKELESTPLSIDKSQKSTLRIYPKAELDFTKNGEEAIPAGSMVTFAIPYDEYNYAGSNGNITGSHVITDSVNAEGYIEVEIPSSDNGVNVSVFIHGFEYAQVQLDGSTKDKWYAFTSTSYTMYTGYVNYQNQSASSVNSVDESHPYTATLIGYVTAELDKTKAGFENVPSGTQVLIKSDNVEFNTTVDVDANGMYTATVPIDADGDDFTVTVLQFTFDQVQPLGETPSTRKTEYNDTDVSYSNVMPGQVRTELVTIDDTKDIEPDAAIEFVTISGQIFVPGLDATGAGADTLASKNVIFYVVEDAAGDDLDWSTEVTTTSTGTYNVDVPKGAPVLLRCEILDLAGVAADASAVTYRLVVEDKSVTTKDYDQGDVNISLSGLTEVTPPSK